MTELTWLAASAAVVAGISALASERRRRLGAARVARAAHELRGALSTLSLGLELAHRRPLGSERARALQLQLHRAAVALDELTGLPGERLCEPVDIAELIQDSVEALRPLAARQGTELRIIPGPPVAVSGVRGRLAQALGNLIQNAIEHGDGVVTVRARAGEGLIRLEVLDRGTGLGQPLDRYVVAPGQSRFSSVRAAAAPLWPRPAPRPRAHAHAHGHGLAVTAAVARDHGGRLLSAPTDRGARLVLELPIRRSRPGSGATSRDVGL